MKRIPHGFKVIIIVLIILAVFSGIGIAVANTQIRDVLTGNSGSFQGDQTTFLYDKDGQVYQSLHGVENRISVNLSEISPYLTDCFIAAEDARFYHHNGIDIIRIFGSILANIRSGNFSQGASTITMQLARNAILEDQSKVMSRKIKEAFVAIALEREYTKDEILELYLNEIHLGHGCYGVESASLKYFGKHAGELTLAEAATIVGLAPSPRTYSPLLNPDRSKIVRNGVLDDLVIYKASYEAEAITAKQEEVKVAKTLAETQEYNHPWFTDYVINQTEDILQEIGLSPSKVYTGGLRIYTTMDERTQQTMDELYTDNSNFPSSNTENIVESAAVVVDHSNGYIWGLVGGREHSTKRALSRATDIARQPGSSFKPVAVYGPALEAGYSPDSLVDDSPTTFGAKYKPKNYDGRYRGLITMRTAIQYSVNIPAVKFMQKLGVEYCIPYIEKSGIDMSDNMDAGLSMALGGLTTGVSPLKLAGAYGVFANQGVYIEPIAIIRIEDADGNIIYKSKQKTAYVYTEQNAWLMTSMLMTVTNSGTGTAARMNRPVASKTGTTQLPDKAAFRNIRIGNKDAWFAAYTPELVGIVWMGYDQDLSAGGQPQYLRQVYGGKYPARLWKAIMTEALADMPIKQFPKPDSTFRRVKNLDNTSAIAPKPEVDENGGIIITNPTDEIPSDLTLPAPNTTEPENDSDAKTHSNRHSQGENGE